MVNTNINNTIYCNNFDLSLNLTLATHLNALYPNTCGSKAIIICKAKTDACIHVSQYKILYNIMSYYGVICHDMTCVVT